MMKIKNKTGQSTVEYVLLVTAVIAVIIAFVAGSNSGGFKSQLNSSLNTAASDMEDLAGNFDGSHTTTLTSNSTTPPYSVAVGTSATTTGTN